MENLTVCEVYQKMCELAKDQHAPNAVNIPALARVCNSTESLIMEYVQALRILDYVKGVDGDHVIL